MRLDRIDVSILDELQNDARLSNKELAGRVGLAPSSCLERVRRLEGDGVVRGYHAEVETRALGIDIQALISIRLRNHSRDGVEEFRRDALARQEVIAVYHLAGAIDFLVHVAVPDTRHLRDLALEAFSTRDEVEHVETSLIFDHARRWIFPNYKDME